MEDLTDLEIAGRVNGKHGGRRHLKLKQIALLKIQTQRACGMEFAEKGDRRTPEQSAKEYHSAPSDAKSAPVITAESVAKDANVSKATARNAIKDAKKLEQEAKQTEEERAAAEAAELKKKADKAARSKRGKAAAEAAKRNAFWQETAETTATQLAAAEAELEARSHDDEELRADAIEEMSRVNTALTSQLEDFGSTVQQVRPAGAQREEIDRRLPDCAAGGTPAQSASEGRCGGRR